MLTNFSTSILPKIKEEIKLIISDYLADYEKETGKAPSPVVVRIAAWLDDAGKKFNAMGFRDGSNSKPPLADTVFTEWAGNSFPDDPEITELCADFVRDCYHDGLAEGRAIA